MTRRTMLLAPLALAARSLPAQALRPRIQITWITAPAVPEEFARESMVFPRAYVCCPTKGLSKRALETGRFPHAATVEDPSLMTLEGSPSNAETITVLTAESGNGEDSPSQRSILVPLAIRWPSK